MCMAAISLPLSPGFSTLHDIDAFRCSVAEISDYLASNKRLIVLIISAFRSSCPIGPHFPQHYMVFPIKAVRCA